MQISAPKLYIYAESRIFMQKNTKSFGVKH